MSKAALLVQDEPAVRRLLRIRFEGDGVPVVEAPSARQALAIFRQQSSDIGVVISAVRMNGLCGEDLLEALREADPVVPVLFFSSTPPNEPLPPNVVVFDKPGGLGALVRAVRELIPVVA
jgi:DNA-binding NtrC family response regulator